MQQLLRKVPLVAAVVLDKVVAHGLKPNLAAGKTELMVHLVGPGSKEASRGLHVAGGIFFSSSYSGRQKLLLTDRYTHMGGDRPAP